jgi:hypothetical protein
MAKGGLYRVTRGYALAFDPSKLHFVEASATVMYGMIPSKSRLLTRKYLEMRKRQFPDNPEKWFIILRPCGTRVQLLPAEPVKSAEAKTSL